jgi:dephospho-CoA kinase
MQNLVDRVLVIDAPPEQQLARLIERDNIDKTLAKKMIAQQADREERLSYADDIINNHGSPKLIKKQVFDLHHHYLSLAAK